MRSRRKKTSRREKFFCAISNIHYNVIGYGGPLNRFPNRKREIDLNAAVNDSIAAVSNIHRNDGKGKGSAFKGTSLTELAFRIIDY